MKRSVPLSGQTLIVTFQSNGKFEKRILLTVKLKGTARSGSE